MDSESTEELCCVKVLTKKPLGRPRPVKSSKQQDFFQSSDSDEYQSF